MTQRPPSLDSPGPDVVPDVIGSMARRSWAADALCATPDEARHNWLLAVNRKHEPATLAADRITTCASCPVRIECLEDAMSETTYTLTGVFGGTVMTERLAAIEHAAGAVGHGTDAEIRATAAAILEATLSARIAMWRHRAQRRAPLGLVAAPSFTWCPDCGQGYLWADRDQRCTRTCRRVRREHADSQWEAA